MPESKNSFFSAIARGVARAFGSVQSPAEAPEADLPTDAELTAELSAPVPLDTDKQVLSGTMGLRRAIDDAVAGGWKPARLAATLEQAGKLQNPRLFFSLAEEMEERDLNYRSVISTRKLSVASLPWHVEAASSSAQDKEIAAFVSEQLNSEAVRGALEGILDAISKGMSITEIKYKRGAARWTVDCLETRPMRHFVFSLVDGRTPLLLNAEVGGQPEPLKPGKYIVHSPQLKLGLPIKSGLALPAAWAYVLKQLTLRDWVQISESNGRPSVVGKYDKTVSKEDIAMLKRAVAGLSPMFSAVLPAGTEIESMFADAKSAVEIHENFCRYLDEQVAKLVLGASLTSGTSSTGSNTHALGKVHADVKTDITCNDAQSLAATIMRDLVVPLVLINFGPKAKLPTIKLVVKQSEDLVGLVGVAEKLAGIGVPLSKTKLAERFNLPLALTPEDAVVVPTKASDRLNEDVKAPAPGKNDKAATG